MEDAQELFRPAFTVFAGAKSAYEHAPGSGGEPTAIKVQPSCSLLSGDTFGCGALAQPSSQTTRERYGSVFPRSFRDSQGAAIAVTASFNRCSSFMEPLPLLSPECCELSCR